MSGWASTGGPGFLVFPGRRLRGYPVADLRTPMYPSTEGGYMSVRKIIPWDTEALISQVRSVCIVEPHTGCWLWNYHGNTVETYPEIMIRGRRQNVSRWILQVTTGVLAPVARHSCDRPRCCNPEHLSWGSYQDNSNDAITRGRVPSGDDNSSRRKPERLARGEAHGRSVLTEEVVRAIRASHAAGESMYGLAKQYNVTKRTIQQIIRRNTWNHVL
jgi:hypothetical protein